MGFRTGGLGMAYDDAQKEAIRVKGASQKSVNTLAGGPVSTNLIITIMGGLKSSIELWDAAAALTGIKKYAENEENNPAYDAPAEFIAMRVAAVTAADECITLLGGVNNVIQKDTVRADWSIDVATVTAAQSLALQGALAVLDAAIELV